MILTKYYVEKLIACIADAPVSFFVPCYTWLAGCKHDLSTPVVVKEECSYE